MAGLLAGTARVFTRAATLVAANGRRTAGDRRVLAISLGMPVLVMILVGALFNSGRGRVTIGVASAGSGPLGAALVADLQHSTVVRVRPEPTLAAATADLRRGVVLLAVEVPSGYDAALRSGRQAHVVVRGQLGQTSSTQAQIAVTQLVDAQSGAVAAARRRPPGVSFDTALAAASTRLAAHPVPLVEEVTAKRTVDLQNPSVSPYAYTAPANVVLFVFILSFVTASRGVQDRQAGLTRRILATPTPPAAVVVGELGTAFVVALGQAVFLLVVGALVFGVHWGDLPATAVLTVALCLAGAGAGATLGTLVRSVEQVVAVGVPLALALGMLGGCMWPLAIVGPVMRAVGHAVPTAWAMDGFVSLVYGHAGLGGIGGDVLVLASFAVALTALAALRLRSAVFAS